MGECYPSAVPDQAEFGRRLFAVLLDGLMSDAVAHLVTRNTTQGVRLLLPTVVFFVEVAFLTALQGASAGQRLVRLQVVDAATGGRLPTGRSILRTLLICLVIPALFTKEGRGYHDCLAGSVVVKA